MSQTSVRHMSDICQTCLDFGLYLWLAWLLVGVSASRLSVRVMSGAAGDNVYIKYHTDIYINADASTYNTLFFFEIIITLIGGKVILNPWCTRQVVTV